MSTNMADNENSIRCRYCGQRNQVRLDSGDVRFETDFRSVYARLLEQWLGVSSVPILGGDFRAGAPAIF